ncbi:hypothetical protein BS47DRAFT_1365548 [Hydnum rufescens UP504]|uniref:Uncharacterized protein n=1 Tax=Hydnum rufescens UP504 TaxID=1448309 RepID=A0A9P6AND3_9AGAM|nr:hypothetical protein BS47DRAFT_1365548 [Hydnum rufescens UP504]
MGNEVASSNGPRPTKIITLQLRKERADAFGSEADEDHPMALNSRYDDTANLKGLLSRAVSRRARLAWQSNTGLYALLARDAPNLRGAKKIHKSCNPECISATLGASTTLRSDCRSCELHAANTLENDVGDAMRDAAHRDVGTSNTRMPQRALPTISVTMEDVDVPHSLVISKWDEAWNSIRDTVQEATMDGALWVAVMGLANDALAYSVVNTSQISPYSREEECTLLGWSYASTAQAMQPGSRTGQVKTKTISQKSREDSDMDDVNNHRNGTSPRMAPLEQLSSLTNVSEQILQGFFTSLME